MIRILLGSGLAACAAGLAAAFVAPTIAWGPSGEPMVVARSEPAKWQPASFDAADCPSRFLLAQPSPGDGAGGAPRVDDVVVLTLRARKDYGAPVGDGQARRSPTPPQIFVYIGPEDKTGGFAGKSAKRSKAAAAEECGGRSDKFITLGSI